MKQSFAIGVILCVLIGCSKHNEQLAEQPIKQPIATTAALVDTNTNLPSDAVKQSVPTRKIFGAFGWRLGQHVSTNKATPDFLGVGYDLDIETTNFPPFNFISIGLLDDGRIYTIKAVTDFFDTETKRDLVLSSLTNKYGPAQYTEQPWVERGTIMIQKWTIDDGYSEIALTWADTSAPHVKITHSHPTVFEKKLEYFV